MTEYCNEGDKPRIEYSFGDKKKRIYQSELAPIEVISERLAKSSQNEKYNPKGFQITNANGSKSVVINYRTRTQGGQLQVQYWSCGNTDWDNRQSDGTYTIWYPLDSPIVAVNRAIGCPPPFPDGDCAIRIKHDDQTLFFDKGDCPLNFDVICGKCPLGQRECKQDKYPGYCCQDCAGTAGKINNLAGKVGKCCG